MSNELKFERLGDANKTYPASTLVIRKQFVDAAIAELKDKCQMHDFFWEGCGFAKRGFKNTIAVSEAFDTLEAENESLLQQNRELCQALQVMYSKEEYDKQKYKRCLAMAKLCHWKMGVFIYKEEKSNFYHRWFKRWLKIADQLKGAK